MNILESIGLLYRQNFNENTHRRLRDSLNQLANIPVKTLTEDYIVTDDDLGYCLQSLSDDPIAVSINASVSTGLFFTLERLGTGALSLQGDSVEINGIEAANCVISDQYTSLYARVFDTAKIKVEGNVIVS